MGSNPSLRVMVKTQNEIVIEKADTLKGLTLMLGEEQIEHRDYVTMNECLDRCIKLVRENL